MNSSDQLKMTVYASLFAALTAVGAYISIPIGPVPIVLQNMFVLIAGLLLGSRWGLASIAVYLLAGTFGLPVFAGGTGGIGHIAGPTGGYLIGFLPAVFLTGIISEKTPGRIRFDVLAMVSGSLMVYLFGVAWLKTVTGMSLGKTMAVGMYPFLIGDTLKIAAAVSVVKIIRPVMEKRLVTA